MEQDRADRNHTRMRINSRTTHRVPRFPLLMLTLLLGVYVPVGHPGSAQAKQAKEDEQDATVQVYKKVAPATVFIKSSALVADHLGGGVNNSIGCGVLLDDQGSILTNAHVVEGAGKILVVLHDGTRLPAVLVGSDPITDLALLRLELPKGHRAIAQLGDSDRVEIGQKVMAIGHPFGLSYALTTGVVSGFGTTPDTGHTTQDRVIQTSAAINPGNSGGPLVDAKGRVIGINTALLRGGQNIAFAIPINTAKMVVPELRTHGRVIRPWLGFSGKLLSEDVIKLFAFPLEKGLLVEYVEDGSPAKKAGLRAGSLGVTIEGEPWVLGGDIVVAVNGHYATSARQFVNAFKALKVGQSIDLLVMREGANQTVTVTLEEQPQAQVTYAPANDPERSEVRPLTQRSALAGYRSHGLRGF